MPPSQDVILDYRARNAKLIEAILEHFADEILA